MGASGPDILLSTLAKGLLPYSIECKSRAAIAVYEWLEQRMGEENPALVVAKGNRKEPIVILYAEDFFKLLHE